MSFIRNHKWLALLGGVWVMCAGIFVAGARQEVSPLPPRPPGVVKSEVPLEDREYPHPEDPPDEDTAQDESPMLGAPDEAGEPTEQHTHQQPRSPLEKALRVAETVGGIGGGVATGAEAIRALRKYLQQAKIPLNKFPKVARLKELRATKHLTQQQLAVKAGVAKSTISKLERGSQRYKPETVYKIAEALGVEATDLLEPIRLEPVPSR